MQSGNNSAGFSIIELVVGVVVLIILASTASIYYLNQSKTTPQPDADTGQRSAEAAKLAASLPSLTPAQAVLTPAPTPVPTPQPTAKPIIKPTVKPTVTPTIKRPTLVTGLSAKSELLSTNGCVQQFQFTAAVTVNKAGTVEYVWLRSDNSKAQSQLLTFTEAGTKTLTTGWMLSPPAGYKGWQQLSILAPDSLLSEKATFTKDPC